MAKKELETRIEKLEAINEELEARAERIAAIIEIMNLQSRYNLWLNLGYYKRIWNELFAHKDPRVKCEIGDSGVYEGQQSVKRLWMALADRERDRGYMEVKMLMEPYIVLSEDGKTAKGMWPAFGPHSDHVTRHPGGGEKLIAYWFSGKYDNEFVKEDGKWKILSLHTVIYLRTPFDEGWLKEPDCARWRPLEDAPPDKPSNFIEPYHPDGVFYPLPAPPEPYKNLSR